MRLSESRPSMPEAATGKSLAIVHEWIQSRAGSEQTFERMAWNFPEADLFALTCEPSLDIGTYGRSVRTTPLQRSAWLRRHRGLTLPIMPFAWRLMPRIDSDLLVTSSHAFSRLVRTSASTRLSYVYTPMRYAWTPEIDQRGGGSWARPARSVLKRIDLASVKEVDEFAGISSEVVNRIRQFYNRDARLIFPPVETDRFSPPLQQADREDYLLGVSRWIPYKRLDLVISVGEAVGLPVKIAGRGPEKERLLHLARSARVPVEVVESPSDVELARLYQRARMLIFPPYEDFGIVPIEAQASGTPVVAFGRGGSVDTVLDGVTGALAPTQDLPSFVAAAKRVLALGDVTQLAVKHAANFSPAVFDEKFSRWVNEYL